MGRLPSVGSVVMSTNQARAATLAPVAAQRQVIKLSQTVVDNSNATGECDKRGCENEAVAVVYFENTGSKKHMCVGHAGGAAAKNPHARTGNGRSYNGETKDSLSRPEGSKTLEWADEETLAAVWNDFETFWVGASSNSSDGSIHLFKHCSMLRGRTDKRKSKPVSAFPVGWKQPCRHCVYLWEHNDSSEVREVLSRYADE